VQAAGAQLRVVRAPNLALDLDTPDDWALLQGYTSAVSAL
jgi:CTP:molybdopterin cytidylyltransferase MocA